MKIGFLNISPHQFSTTGQAANVQLKSFTRKKKYTHKISEIISILNRIESDFQKFKSQN